jgi:Mrr N-terminal domain
MSIDPPDKQPTPKWASTLVNAAKSRNHARGSDVKFTTDDLAVVWAECGGRCAVSGMPFSFQVVGDGRARHPYAPSLDRINRYKPYSRSNVRLVASIANFAMNAWGLDPLIQLAMAVYSKHGDRDLPTSDEKVDAEINDPGSLDGDEYQTTEGIVSFPPREDLFLPILKFLRGRERLSRDIEDMLAKKFRITDEQRRVILANGHPAWRNHVAWTLASLVMSDEIERFGQQRAPDGGTTGIYRIGSGTAKSGLEPLVS